MKRSPIAQTSKPMKRSGFAAPRKVYKRASLHDRLMRKIVRIPQSGCWIFTGAVTPQGYGKIGTGNGPEVSGTHRVAYQLFKGAIPEGMMVCHHCDVPSCCNPYHLFVGSALTNVRDMMTKGRHRVSDEVYPGVGRDLRDFKLSYEERHQIKALRICGASIKELAAQFDSTALVISKLCSRISPTQF